MWGNGEKTMSSSIIAIIIAAITIVLFMWNKLPMSVVAMGSSVAMGILIPQMELSEVYAGFSAPGWAMVVGMCIVSAALFETGMAQKIGDRIGNSFLAKTERRFIVTASAVCCLMSAFMSNNGTVAIWMPLIAVVAAGSNGRIRSKMVIFPAGTAAVIGGHVRWSGLHHSLRRTRCFRDMTDIKMDLECLI